MALSDKVRLFLKAGIANNEAGEELADKVDALQAALNALLDELEARRDAAETVADSADGVYEGLKVED